MTLLDLAAVVSPIWGLINLLQVIIAKWDTPNWWRTLYCAGTTLSGIAILGAVGFDLGWFSLFAAVGALNHLSATLVHAGFCLRSNEAAVR